LDHLDLKLAVRYRFIYYRRRIKETWQRRKVRR